MKQLLASCAVIALMAAPALAQSTDQPDYPPVETDVMKEAPVSDDPEIAPESVPAAETPESVTAEAAPEADVDIAQASAPDAFEAPIDANALPDDYSTDDLNALMLAQLSQPVMTVAAAPEPAESDAYATAETATPESQDAETYAGTTSDGTAAAEPEAYASAETPAPAVEGESTAAADDTAVAPEATDETTDDSVQMAEQPDGAPLTAEGDIDQTAVEIAARDDRFSTFVELVGISGLETAFSQEGPFTVFAPTNDAFAALPAPTLDRLKSEAGKAELVEVLKAHVVQGAVMAEDVPATGKQAMSAAQLPLNLTGRADGTLSVSGINTLGDGIYASNGLVYAIDAVILPEAVPVAAGN